MPQTLERSADNDAGYCPTDKPLSRLWQLTTKCDVNVEASHEVCSRTRTTIDVLRPSTLKNSTMGAHSAIGADPPTASSYQEAAG